MERAHHPYSPSTLQSLECCPAYRGKESTHERTTAGTLAHGVAESGVDDNRLNDEDAVAAATCIDFVEQRKIEIQTRTGHAPSELKEEYLPIDDVVFEDGSNSTTAGYADHILIDYVGEYAELIDHKFGIWKVEKAASNLQGIAYSLGLFRRFPTLRKIRVWFVQPHADYITDAIFTREQIPELYLRIRAVVERARIARQSGSFESANPTTPNCLFCANVGRCPKLLAMALQTAKKFHPIAFPEHITPTMVLDSHQSALAMQLAGVMKVWADSFRAATTDRVLRGGAELPEGYEIVSRSTRSIADSKKFEEEALKQLTEDEYRSTLEPAFGAVEKKIQDKAPRGHKKTTVEAFKQSLLDGGAVVKSEPYVFLKAIAKDE